MAEIRAITIRLGDEETTQSFEGRTAWALSNLLAAGAKGCTPITHPGPRWSDYVFKLRKAGLVIETLHEHHEGKYAGHHGRYILRTPLTVVREVL